MRGRVCVFARRRQPVLEDDGRNANEILNEKINQALEAVKREGSWSTARLVGPDATLSRTLGGTY